MDIGTQIIAEAFIFGAPLLLAIYTAIATIIGRDW